MQLSFLALFACSLQNALLSLTSLSVSLCPSEGFWVIMTILDIRIASLDMMDLDTNAQSCVGTPTAAGMDGVVRTFLSDSFMSRSKFGYIPSWESKCLPFSFKMSYLFGEIPHYGGDRESMLAKIAPLLRL